MYKHNEYSISGVILSAVVIKDKSNKNRWEDRNSISAVELVKNIDKWKSFLKPRYSEYSHPIKKGGEGFSSGLKLSLLIG